MPNKIKFIGEASVVDIGGEAFIADLDEKELAVACIKLAIEWGDVTDDGEVLISSATIYTASRHLQRTPRNDS